MRQLEAFKINWPLWTAYILEQDNWPAKVMFKLEEVLEKYSPRLLEILETEGRYKSPETNPDQLDLF